MSSAVIIILREVLEAALLISVLLASSKDLNLRYHWLFIAFLIGISGSAILASQLTFITDAADGIGQELFNAVLLSIIILLLLAAIYRIASKYYHDNENTNPSSSTSIMWLFIVIVSITLLREGTEIYIYCSGFLHTRQHHAPLLLGSCIGFGIGLSAGALIYYLIMSVQVKRLLLCIGIMAFIAAGMSTQSILFLMQAGMLESGPPLWDSTHWINEDSLIGELLYALLSYEATPTRLQISFYLVILMAATSVTLWAKNKANPKA